MIGLTIKGNDITPFIMLYKTAPFGLLFGITYEENYNVVVYKYTNKTGATETEEEV